MAARVWVEFEGEFQVENNLVELRPLVDRGISVIFEVDNVMLVGNTALVRVGSKPLKLDIPDSSALNTRYASIAEQNVKCEGHGSTCIGSVWTYLPDTSATPTILGVVKTMYGNFYENASFSELRKDFC